MIIVAILLTTFLIAVIVYSFCRIPSRACGSVFSKSLVFDDPADEKRFEDLLENGDAESVHRILKALQQRGDIDLVETEKEIRVSGRRGASSDEKQETQRDLLVFDYDHAEDFRNLSVVSRLHPGTQGINADSGISPGKYEAVSATDRENPKDDLFASDYDFIELLENLTIRSCRILPAQTTAAAQ